MLEILSYLHTLAMSPQLLLFCKTGACITQAYILGTIIKSLITKNTKLIWLLITLIILSTVILDVLWIIKLINKIGILTIPFRYLASLCQISYPLDIIRCLCCVGFLDILTQKKSVINLSWYYTSSLAALAGIITLLMYEFTHTANPLIYTHVISLSYPILYLYFIALFIPSIIILAYTSTKNALPAILQYQIHIILYYVVTPYIFFELATTNPFTLFTHTPLRSNYFLISLSTIHLAVSLYYCIKKMALLRFLNIKQQVIAIHTFTFIKDFKNVLDTVQRATTETELSLVTKRFFQSAFSLPAHTIHLTLKNNDDFTTQTTHIEYFLTTFATPEFKQYLYTTKILIYDEIEFSLFYENDPNHALSLSFLRDIRATLFLPIYTKQTMIGYITVTKDAHSRLFTNVDQDEMVLFAGYLTATINALRATAITLLKEKNKELTEELSTKNQEISQYKESIRSLVKISPEKKIGILFYKSQKFIYANHTAQELLPYNLNDKQNTPLIMGLKKLAHSTIVYQQSQSVALKDYTDTLLMINAIPSLEEHQVILTLHHPDLTDILTAQTPILKDPSSLDYLVYLETTESGQLINELMPDSNELLLNFKIDLLRTALSKKAVLLEMSRENLMPAVEILHHISLRTHLHTLHIAKPEKNQEYAFKLFGANPLFNPAESMSLLESLHDTGTLFIENIHFLSHETQEYLADFLTFGFFYKIKSSKKIFCTARIICAITDNTPLTALHPKLFKQLEATTISLPPLPKKMLQELTMQPLSISDFKNIIHEQITHKSLKTTTHHTSDDHLLSDPAIAEAVKLGKKALKNKNAMTLLWNTFKNQSKIATLLGVNRSSVHRRYTAFFLTTESDHDESRISSKNSTISNTP